MKSLTVNWSIDLSSSIKVGKEAIKKAVVYLLELLKRNLLTPSLSITSSTVKNKQMNSHTNGRISQPIDSSLGSVENKKIRRPIYKKIITHARLLNLNNSFMSLNFSFLQSKKTMKPVANPLVKYDFVALAGPAYRLTAPPAFEGKCERFIYVSFCFCCLPYYPSVKEVLCQ